MSTLRKPLHHFCITAVTDDPILKSTRVIMQFPRSEVSAASSGFCVQSLARLKQSFHHLESHTEALGENPPPDSFRLAAKLGSM